MPTTLTTHTTVRNISGVDNRYFDCLGERGATLDDGEDINIPGDLATFCARAGLAKMNALRYCLDHRLLAIIRTPAVIVFDEAEGVTQQIGGDGGDPVLVAPDYGSYAGDPP